MDPNNSNNQASQSSGDSKLDAIVQDALNPNPENLDEQDMASIKMARDPVCGALVEMASATNTLSAPVNDQGEGMIYFDSPECKALYEADPSKYGSSF